MMMDEADDLMDDMLLDEDELLMETGTSEASELPASAWSRRLRRIQEPVTSATDTLEVQWLDIDMTSGQPWTGPDGRVVGSVEGPVPVVRLYGVTALGSSVLVNVHGFTSN